MERKHNRPRSRRARRDLSQCSDCGVPLSTDNTFNFKRRRYICKTCWNARQRAYQSNIHPDDLRARKRANLKAHQDRDPEGFRRRAYGYYIKNQYGFTLAEYDDLLERQGGACAICKGGTKGRGRFHVDHCHGTGQVRGLLCAKCNILLGHANDDTRLLRSAISYLIDPPNA